jgi:sec-independent protein translocase protein TatC
MTDASLPLIAHLEELRWRVLKALAGIAVGFAACYGFSEQIFHLLSAPLLALSDDPLSLIGTGVTEAFFTRLKVSFIAAIFLASPVIFYQTWRFVAPGLYVHEKRTAIPFVIAATLFFVAGGTFCYVVVFPIGYAFFLREYQAIGVAPTIRISEYLTFAARMLLAFGLTFELPVVTFFLARIGVVTHRTLIHWFRYAVLGIFILAAVLTPGPDVASQLLLAAPLLFLYGVSIGVAFVFQRRTPGNEDDEDDTAPAATDE